MLLNELRELPLGYRYQVYIVINVFRKFIQLLFFINIVKPVTFIQFGQQIISIKVRKLPELVSFLKDLKSVYASRS